MPRGTALTGAQTSVIDLLRKDDTKSIRAIARHINKSEKVVRNYLKNPTQYGTLRTTGRKPKLSERESRLVIREACIGEKSLEELRISLNLPIKKSSIRRLLHSSGYLAHRRMKTAPYMTPRNKSVRLEWCMENIKFKQEEWRGVIFSDEKKFNLDGPDGWAYYWHDLRTEPRIFTKRQMGGDSVMLWSCFSYHGKGPIVYLNGRVDAKAYQKVLESELLPWAANTHGETWQFQQDNAPIHTARLIRRFFADNGMDVLDWPARSPDLNPIENLWALLARRVYANSRHFSDVAELKDAIQEAWEEIEDSVLRNLSESMPRRLKAAIRVHGDITKY